MASCSEGGSWCSALPENCNDKLLSLEVEAHLLLLQDGGNAALLQWLQLLMAAEVLNVVP